MLTLTIPGQPIAKGRPRLSVRGGHARAYTPGKTRRWENAAAAVIGLQLGPMEPISRPVAVEIDVAFARPKRLSGGDSGRVVHDKRPDLDNVIKAVLDALTLARVWVDDALVSCIASRKSYAAEGEEPSVCVRIRALSEV